MRKTCTDCALKHLSQATILLKESKQGYPLHAHYARGHMAEAEAELIKLYPKHAELVRQERKKLEENPNFIPDFPKLIKKIDRECEVCDLANQNEIECKKCLKSHTLTECRSVGACPKSLKHV